jgi:murein DD-endopeptidase MepM/ murein hydrolase activator NlpD
MKNSCRQFRLKGKNVIVTGVLCLLAFCMTAYFYFAPGYAGTSPIACNLPSGPFAEPAGTAQCAFAEDSSAQNCAVACQEISEVTDPGDTLFSLLKDNVADEASARTVASKLASLVRPTQKKGFDADTPLESGKRYSVTVDPEGAFLKATIEMEPANVFHAVLQEGAIRCWKEEVVLDFKVESLVIKMNGDLEKSIIAAGEGQELAAKLAKVFQWDINFRTESKRGDTCKVLFERRYADDRPSGYGNILCAEYRGKKIGKDEEQNKGKKTAVLFNGKYYDDKGVELKKDFLRSPLKLKVLRITSKYGMRFHPIRKVLKKHNGVDYGAPEGTPVLTVANGVVTFAGWHEGGYGNYVCVRHDNGYESRYGHLQRYFVKVGERVRQTQKIGLVGMTGVATGPHLDFQLLASNRHINPHTKIVQTLRTVPAPLKHRFLAVANERLAAFEKVALAGPYQTKAFNQ